MGRTWLNGDPYHLPKQLRSAYTTCAVIYVIVPIYFANHWAGWLVVRSRLKGGLFFLFLSRRFFFYPVLPSSCVPNFPPPPPPPRAVTRVQPSYAYARLRGWAPLCFGSW